MKQMEYKKIEGRELLDSGVYKHHEYFVISFGSHPCAYIKLNGENRTFAENVPCHGGVTYSENYLYIAKGEKIKGDFIGWDYAHYGDYLGFDKDFETGDKYTTGQIVAECKSVIDDLIDDYCEVK